jgi:4-carboxymuconolactone decarboxylase
MPETLRIAPLEPPYAPETEELLRKWMAPGADVEPLALFRTLAVHDVGDRARGLGGASSAALS